MSSPLTSHSHALTFLRYCSFARLCSSHYNHHFRLLRSCAIIFLFSCCRAVISSRAISLSPSRYHNFPPLCDNRFACYCAPSGFPAAPYLGLTSATSVAFYIVFQPMSSIRFTPCSHPSHPSKDIDYRRLFSEPLTKPGGTISYEGYLRALELYGREDQLINSHKVHRYDRWVARNPELHKRYQDQAIQDDYKWQLIKRLYRHKISQPSARRTIATSTIQHRADFSPYPPTSTSSDKPRRLF